MVDITWEDPIESSDYDSGLEGWPDALKERPGQWARLPVTFPTSPKAAAMMKRPQGSKGIWSGGRWEATQRKLNDEQAVYVRYLGPLEGEGRPLENPE